MKRIFYVFIFVISVVSCHSPTGEITDIAKYRGTYKGNQPTLQKRALALQIDGAGGFSMGYVATNDGNIGSPPYSFKVDATNITGVDPNYSFQNSKGAGTLKFVTENKVIVTFRELTPDYYAIGETVCTKTTTP